MANKTIRVVTREADGSLRTKDYATFDELNFLHEKVGVDDCSTDLSLRGMPVFRGLVGPMPESKSVVRYESPDVFEAMTKEWSQLKTRRRRRSTVPAPASNIFSQAGSAISIPNAGTPTSTV
jgi:hypothetical protein